MAVAATMRRIALPFACLVALAGQVAAQPFPQTLPANTVYGRLGIGPGPGQAIPFATLQANIFAPPLNINLNTAAMQPCPSGCNFAHFQGANAVSNQIQLNAYGVPAASHNALTHILGYSARGTALAPTAIGAVVDLSPNQATTLGDYSGLFIGGCGYDGTTYACASDIAFRPAEQWTSTKHGANIMFGVTQTGASGGAPAYRFMMAAGGYFVVNQNTLAPPTLVFDPGTTLQLLGADAQRVAIELNAFNNPTNFVAKRNGGSLAGGNAAVAGGSTVFAIGAYPNNGTGYVANALITFLTDNTQSGTDSSSYISFFAIDKLSTTLTEVARMWGNGGLSIGASVSAPNVRMVLTAARTYYVRTDGSDSNTCLVNTAGGACLTINGAYAKITGLIDFGGQTVTVQVGAGTYTTANVLNGPWVGGGALVIQGDTTTPDNVVINVAGAPCFSINTNLPGTLTIAGFKLTTTVAGNGIFHNGSGTVQVGVAGSNTGMDFGATIQPHMVTTSVGARILMIGGYTISGGAPAHMRTFFPSVIEAINTMTITLSGSPAFSPFADASNGSIIFFGAAQVTFSGSAAAGTKKYHSTINSIINVSSGGGFGGPNYFPGDVAGVADIGGLYQ